MLKMVGLFRFIALRCTNPIMRKTNRSNSNSPAPNFPVPCVGYVIGYYSACSPMSGHTKKQLRSIVQVQINPSSGDKISLDCLVEICKNGKDGRNVLLPLFSKINIRRVKQVFVSQKGIRKIGPGWRSSVGDYDVIEEGLAFESKEEVCAVIQVEEDLLTVISRSVPLAISVFCDKANQFFDRNCFAIGDVIKISVPPFHRAKLVIWNGMALYLLNRISQNEAAMEPINFIRTLKSDTIRRTTTHELHKILTRCRLVRNLNLEDAEKFILGPHIAAALLENHIQNQSAKDVTVTKSVTHEYDAGNRRHFLKFVLDSSEVQSCIKTTGMNSWRVGSDLSATHLGKLKEQKVFVSIDKIYYASNGTATVRVQISSHSKNLFDMLLSAEADDIWNEWVIGPSQKDFCALAEALDVLFEPFFKNSRLLFDRWRGYVIGEPKELDLVQMKVIKDGKDSFLDESQLEAVRLAGGTEGFTCVAAPPGSGKTFTIAALTGLWRSNDVEKHRNYISCTTNAAVSNAIEAIRNCYSGIKVVRDFSIKAELEASNSIAELSLRKMSRRADKYLTPEKVKRIEHEITQNMEAENAIKSKIGKNDIAAVLNRLKALRVSQHLLRNAFVNVYAPEVYGATSSIFVLRGRNYYEINSKQNHSVQEDEKNSQNCIKEHLIIDEAAQMSPIEALALYCTLGNSSSITLFGDTKQLGPFTQCEAGSEIHQFVCDGELTRMEKMGQPQVMLKHIYRCHPRIVDLFFKPIYGPTVVGSTPKERRAIVLENELPMAMDGSPCVFVQVDNEESSTGDLVNKKELNLVYSFILTLKSKKLYGEDVVVICHHRAQREALVEKMRGMGEIGGRKTIVPVHTIDSFQGKEAKIVIVLTTKTIRGNCALRGARTLAFVSDEHRGCVAVSRAQHGLYIFGDWHGLNMTPFWKKFIPGVIKSGGLVNSNWQHLERIPYYKECSITSTSILLPAKSITSVPVMKPISETSSVDEMAKAFLHISMYENHAPVKLVESTKFGIHNSGKQGISSYSSSTPQTQDLIELEKSIEDSMPISNQVKYHSASTRMCERSLLDD